MSEMAAEQLRAFLKGEPQDGLGPVTVIGPDRYPMLDSSELIEEHQFVSRLLEGIETTIYHEFEPRTSAIICHLLNSDSDARTRFYLALIERAFAIEARLTRERTHSHSYFFGYGQAAAVMVELIQAGVVTEAILEPSLAWAAAHRNFYYGWPLVEALLSLIDTKYRDQPVPTTMRNSLVLLRAQVVDEVGCQLYRPILKELDRLLGNGLWQVLAPGEVWTDTAINQLSSFSAEQRASWVALLLHCQSATSSTPSAKWSKLGYTLKHAVGEMAFRQVVGEWFALVDKARSLPVLSAVWEGTDERQRMHSQNATILRGLLWNCMHISDSTLCRDVAKVALSGYRKVAGIGPRAVKVGNAAVYVLGQIGTSEAAGQLALLKAKVKFIPAQKGIEKALNAAAERLGLPRDEIEEMAVPAYGLEEVGVRREQFGDYTTELLVTGPSSAELRWKKADGSPQKSVPAAVKKDHGDDLKELQAAAKDIQKMLPAQRDRIDSLFLARKTWPLTKWRERYLDHPLVGVIARRLIWRFGAGKSATAGIFHDGQLVGSENKPLRKLGDDAVVSLWHPLDEATDAVLAWRAWLEKHEVQQPFKQAHREIYVLTDAERRTGTYSNRYAAHVLKQHQFNALCGIRHWRNKLRLMVDAEFPPAMRYLPEWNLRAEFWIEGAGDEYGQDTNETGTFLHLTTDQVRFYRIEATQRTAHAGGGGYVTEGPEGGDQPLPLTDIPPLVFSEIMRDVDLFVGVASVGNDPNWADGGPQGRYRDYWQSYSFGDLSATAQTRKAVLEKLVPRLKVAPRCSFNDKFLVVKGDLRAYKIHLGSGNILMAPNDQYLCIVAKQSASIGTDRVFLPFEGDNTLAVILSKAFLLADDTKIKDPSIVSQLKGQ